MKRFLFETTLGDLLLRLFERLTGCAIVEVGEIEDARVAATAKGRATSRAPASGD